jgi:hypothetical protein
MSKVMSKGNRESGTFLNTWRLLFRKIGSVMNNLDHPRRPPTSGADREDVGSLPGPVDGRPP